MNIDAHQHFWIYNRADYGWMDAEPLKPLRRDFLPEDLRREQARVGFDGSIVVQARQTLEESRWLLELAERDERIKGVVGWVDLRAGDVDKQLGQFAGHPKFAGVRHVVQDEPDERFLLREDFLRGIGRLKDYGLTYDILIYPKQLPAALEFVPRFPDQPFVLDHLAKPFIKDGKIDPWKQQIRELAQFPNVECKISGLVTEADWKNWKEEDFKPFLDVAAEAFGVERLMFGSDWGVCTLAATHDEVVSIARNYFQRLDADAKRKVFGGNCLRFYGCG